MSKLAHRAGIVAALLAAATMVLVASPAAAAPARSRPAGADRTTADARAPSGVDLQAMDRSVAAGDDFYRFANGHWLETTRIPADESRWGTFNILARKVDGELHRLLTAPAAPDENADIGRARTWYQAYADAAAIEARGLAPLEPGMAAIEAVQDTGALADALGAAVRADVDPVNQTQLHTANLAGIWVAPALHDASVTLPYLLQGGLSLPDRQYYLTDNPHMARIRARFLQHVERVFTLAGLDNPGARAQAVIDLETRLAQGHASRQDSEDVDKADHVWTRQDFAEQAPGLDWARFLAACGLGTQERIGVWHPTALAAASRLAGEVPLATWRDWMRLHLLDAHADVLPKAFADEAFAMYGTALSGAARPHERWQRALDATSHALPDAVGQLYVAHHFSADSKARVQALVKAVLDAFDRRIAKLDWMEAATREHARAKLRALYVGIGYPDHWQDYEGLEVRPDDAFGNLDRAGLHHRTAELALLGRPYDRTRWCMAAQEVNAVNLPVQNALNFPASILQPPFFDPRASDAVNLGAIGTTIGHEISHSFDDEGAKIDEHGELRNWWTERDLAHFRAASAALARQYSAYRPFADAAVNGEQTLSENIADVAGVAAAHDALLAHLGEAQARRAARGAYTPEQEFFISFAQTWQQAIRAAALRQRLVTDGHAPARYRAATVRNLDAWYRAFGVRRTQKLWLDPGQRVTVW